MNNVMWFIYDVCNALSLMFASHDLVAFNQMDAHFKCLNFYAWARATQEVAFGAWMAPGLFYRPLILTKALGQTLLPTLLDRITWVTTWVVAHWTSAWLGKGLTELPNPMTCQNFHRPQIYTWSDFMRVWCITTTPTFSKIKTSHFEKKRKKTKEKSLKRTIHFM